VKARWNAKKAEVSGLPAFIDARAAYIDTAQDFNFRKWTILDKYVWPNAKVPGSYAGEIAYLKGWLQTRLAWFEGAINGL
jgi:hypothetical protein